MTSPSSSKALTAGSITHQSKTNFLYSFLLLPKEKRHAIETVYAFCRVVDDIVDDEHPVGDPRDDLNLWRGEIAACFNGRAPSLPLAGELKGVLRDFPIPQEHFLALIRGMEMDLEQRKYRTFAELEEYCYHVAGVIGLMCIEIFGYRHKSAREYAVNLGKALQMVNIIRDLKEDADRGRIYLPSEEIEACGYSEAELFAGVNNDAFQKLIRKQATRAREFRKKALAALHSSDRRRMVAAEIMARIYFKILDRIEVGGFQVFTHRPKLTKAEKAYLAAMTWVRVKL